MAKQTKTPSETPAGTCPVCKSAMTEGTWPPSSAGVLLIANGVFFLLFFAWLVSGAFVEHSTLLGGEAVAPKASGAGEAFLVLFRQYLPLVFGLACLYWGWAVLTQRRSLGNLPVWACANCGHAQNK